MRRCSRRARPRRSRAGGPRCAGSSRRSTHRGNARKDAGCTEGRRNTGGPPRIAPDPRVHHILPMSDTIPAALAGWESYYVIVGSSAAALTGLQFVVIALINDLHTRASGDTLGAFGT